DSIGRSALSIFGYESKEIIEFKRFAHVVVGAAVLSLFSEIAVAGEDDVGNRSRGFLTLQRRAESLARHSLDTEVSKNDVRADLAHAPQRGVAIRHDFGLMPVARQH